MSVSSSGCGDDFHTNYTTGEDLGKGAFAVVKTATRKSDGKSFAVKIITKSIRVSGASQAQVRTEIEALRRVTGHPKVVALEEFYEDKHNVWVVMEHVPGVELFCLLEKYTFFPEPIGCKILCSIFNAVAHCHANNILHRDLKLENLMLSEEAVQRNASEVKLIDFGIAALLDDGQLIQGSIGTPSYVAPEVLGGKEYGLPADMWSLGVLSYVILAGYLPFDASDPIELNNQIIKGEFEFHDPEWNDVSALAKEFISKLLVIRPARRLTIEQALEHPFIRKASVRLQLSDLSQAVEKSPRQALFSARSGHSHRW